MSNLRAQIDVHIPLKSNVQKDSIDALIKKQKILRTFIYSINKQKILSGKKFADTLQVHINNDIYLVSQDSLSLFLTNLNKLFITKGQIFNQIKPNKIALKKNTLHLYYTIEHGEYFSIDSLVYNDAKFPKNIQKLLYKKFKNKQINKQNFIQIKNFIQQYTFFVLERPLSIVFVANKRLARITVHKPLSNTFKGAFGFYYDSADKKVKLQGDMHMSLYNTFITNETIKIKWQRVEHMQIMGFFINIPFIASSNFSIDNSLSTGRKDTLQAFIYNKMQFNYTLFHHTFRVGYLIDQQNEEAQVKYNYLTIGYKYLKQNKNNFQLLNFDFQYDQKKENFLVFFQLEVKNKIYKNFKLHNMLNLMYNNVKNSLSSTNKIQTFYRRFDQFQINKYRINSFKNELIWQKNNLNFYLITDFIQEFNYKKNLKTLINTGFGLRYYQKNKNLTLEFVKPFIGGYDIDYQNAYISIKHQINF